MPVSDEMKQFVYNDVKDAFYKYNGMSGDNEAEQKRYSAAINDYLKTVKKEDRIILILWFPSPVQSRPSPPGRPQRQSIITQYFKERLIT